MALDFEITSKLINILSRKGGNWLLREWTRKFIADQKFNIRIQDLLLWLIKNTFRGAWVAQSVGHPTLAPVMISWSMGSSPVSGSVPIAQSLEPASGSCSFSLSAFTLLTFCVCVCVCVSLSKINKHIQKSFVEFSETVGNHFKCG